LESSGKIAVPIVLMLSRTWFIIAIELNQVHANQIMREPRGLPSRQRIRRRVARLCGEVMSAAVEAVPVSCALVGGEQPLLWSLNPPHSSKRRAIRLSPQYLMLPTFSNSMTAQLRYRIDYTRMGNKRRLSGFEPILYILSLRKMLPMAVCMNDVP